MVPLSVVVPSSVVTVWGAEDIFFQTMVVPALMVSVVGLKPKLPLLMLVISTVCVAPETVVVVAAGCVVVGVGDGLVFVVPVVGLGAATVGAAAAFVLGVLLPHALSSTNAPTTSGQNQTSLLCCCKYDFFDIDFTFLWPTRVGRKDHHRKRAVLIRVMPMGQRLSQPRSVVVVEFAPCNRLPQRLYRVH